MTLGGLALAVGILVDDATVTIENINRYLEHGQTMLQAILDGAQQIAVPALVSTLCICIVFLPMFFLTGVAQAICSCRWPKRWCSPCWRPIFCRERSCPTMAKYLLKAQQHGSARSRNPLVLLAARDSSEDLRHFARATGFC